MCKFRQLAINNDMAKQKKFIRLIENYKRKFESGGFLVGNIFKFNDDFKSQPEYNKLGDDFKDHIDYMINSGLHIRVVDMKNEHPGRYPGSPNGSSSEPVLTIALDNMGGRVTHHCAVPCCWGQPGESPYPNLDPIPDGVRYDNQIQLKPKAVDDYLSDKAEDEENIANMSDAGDVKLRKTERSLPTKNNTIPSKAVTPSMEVGSYTKDYLSDLKG